MNRKPKLKKICHHCKINYQVSQHRRAQKFCSRECASHSVRRHVTKTSVKRKPLESINSEENWDQSDDRKRFWTQNTGPSPNTEELREKSKKIPFHKTSEEVSIAVKKFLNSGGTITVLPSPPIKKIEIKRDPIKDILGEDIDLELLDKLSIDSL